MSMRHIDEYPNKTSFANLQARRFWSLHRGRSRKPLVRVVPDASSPLYRIDWPDIGLSVPANLTRCKDAARQWTERKVLTEDRNLCVAQRLKSLDNFCWLASPVRQIDLDGEFPVPAPERTAEPPASESPQRAVLEEFDSAQAASAWIDGRLSAPSRARFRRAAS
jgi:hypothetical protein